MPHTIFPTEYRSALVSKIIPVVQGKEVYKDKVEVEVVVEVKVEVMALVVVVIIEVFYLHSLNCKLCPRFLRCFHLNLGLLVQKLTDLQMFLSHNKFHKQSGNNDVLL